jgi:hypothetical protein
MGCRAALRLPTIERLDTALCATDCKRSHNYLGVCRLNCCRWKSSLPDGCRELIHPVVNSVPDQGEVGGRIFFSAASWNEPALPSSRTATRVHHLRICACLTPHACGSRFRSPPAERTPRQGVLVVDHAVWNGRLTPRIWHGQWSRYKSSRTAAVVWWCPRRPPRALPRPDAVEAAASGGEEAHFVLGVPVLVEEHSRVRPRRSAGRRRSRLLLFEFSAGGIVIKFR